MIIYACNYCDHSNTTTFAENGAVEKIICEKCKGVIFLRHSTFIPKSWKEEDVVVDEKTKTLTIKKEKE